jgi:enamine deaminase RidA (YjgF/YER057c/UK114 family)
VAPFLETRDRFFVEVYPDGDYPANTLVVVDGLVREGMLVAVTAVAALP